MEVEPGNTDGNHLQGVFSPLSPPSYLLPNGLLSIYNAVENTAFYSRFSAQIAKLCFVLHKTNSKRHIGVDEEGAFGVKLLSAQIYPTK